MTVSDHLEISRKLALAIGWRNVDIVLEGGGICCFLMWRDQHEGMLWDNRPFDYRDSLIAFRVAEQFDAFPFRNGPTQWWSGVGINGPAQYADTPQLAIALAVIAAQGVK